MLSGRSQMYSIRQSKLAARIKSIGNAAGSAANAHQKGPRPRWKQRPRPPHTTVGGTGAVQGNWETTGLMRWFLLQPGSDRCVVWYRLGKNPAGLETG